MSTAPAILERSFRLRPKHGVLAAIVAMMMYVIVHNERFLINYNDPIWEHYQPFKWWLLPHGIAGATALFLGIQQFSDRIRQRYLRWHRIAGRVYVGAVAIAAPLGVYIQSTEGIPTFTLATIVDAVLWMSTTAIAFAFALKGMIPQHRQWMTRSYAVAIVFLEVRVISGLLGYDEDVRMTEAIVWTCLALALLLAGIVIQWQELAAKRGVKQKTAAATT